ncbi:hypothetical protein CYMTET_9913 [Cymbomonas tetramitiformis]|uniref:Zinc finger PHD-type domain-containing protein n=1 Tax=Cymbomonas tetramitiformis TaxID=36881 RepID=A0AAE0GQ66_9CHLO|nr:hypothetical protein CYMTET_9913 [Cymbomonas tetramitiformis]
MKQNRFTYAAAVGAAVPNALRRKSDRKSERKLVEGVAESEGVPACNVEGCPHPDDSLDRTRLALATCDMCSDSFHVGCASRQLTPSGEKRFPGECGRCGILARLFCLFCGMGSENHFPVLVTCATCKRGFHKNCRKSGDSHSSTCGRHLCVGQPPVKWACTASPNPDDGQAAADTGAAAASAEKAEGMAAQQQAAANMDEAPLQEAPTFAAVVRAEPGGGLVEKHQLSLISKKEAGDADAAAPPAAATAAAPPAAATAAAPPAAATAAAPPAAATAAAPPAAATTDAPPAAATATAPSAAAPSRPVLFHAPSSPGETAPPEMPYEWVYGGVYYNSDSVPPQHHGRALAALPQYPPMMLGLDPYAAQTPYAQTYRAPHGRAAHDAMPGYALAVQQQYPEQLRERVQQRQQQQKGQHPRGFRVGTHKAPPVGFDRDEQRAKPFCGKCKRAGKGEQYHFYRDCPLGGRQHPPNSAASFCIPIDEEDAEGVHALAMCAVFQHAADDGAEAFARAAAAYGPPAVLSAGAVGGIDVSAYGFTVEQQPSSEGESILQRLDDLAAEVHSAANPQVHYTHASFPPPAGIGQEASALVCGPAAAVAAPEEQVPAGGAAASASAVPAPAMPVSQGEDVKPAPLQSARVTTTADADGEFAGFVQTVNHAAVGQVDLTGYDTDDYEDLADGSFIVKPRTPAISANHASESATHVPQSGGASRTYGCGKPPWGFPAHAGPWGFHYFVSLFLLISIMGVGAAAYTAANDIGSVQVSGRATPQPVLCRGDLCIYSGISELDPVTLDAVLHSLGAAAVLLPPDPLEGSAAGCYVGRCDGGAPLIFDPE